MQNMQYLFVLILACLEGQVRGNWEEWWTYDGISGPEFWGVLYTEWKMCQWGRQQSPVNVDPSKLVFDPHLRPIHVDKRRVSGTLRNTGQSVIFRVDKDLKHHVNISGGPLVYKYRFDEMYIHFGDGDTKGSEHKINGNSFPAEIQLYGFNVDLYRNMSEARLGPNGIVGIAIMVQIDNIGNEEFRFLSTGLSKVKYKREEWTIRHLSLAGLLPDTKHFLTYEGSTTYPGCWETTTWIIINKPMYMTMQELSVLRSLMQGNRNSPKATMANNFRQIRALNHRTIRTNIDFSNSYKGSGCPSMHKQMLYAARQWQKL